MQCYQCKNKAVIQLQHASVCKAHFLHYFEDKVFKTIKKYQMIGREDKVCVAVSGGKDSLTALYVTKKYFVENNLPLENLFGLAIDEGIKNYREHTLKDLKKFCEENKVKFYVVSAKKEFGFTLDQAIKIIENKTGKKPCNLCGIWRRYLLNKYARKYKATKVITGHNLDDEAQVIVMNWFKANTTLASHLGPISGIKKQKLFVQRVKPLYFCTEKENRTYALIRRFQVHFEECPYAEIGYRAHIRDMLNDFENKYPGTKQGVINSFLSILPCLKEKDLEEEKEIRFCEKCGEPANQKICNTCQLVEVLKNGK